MFPNGVDEQRGKLYTAESYFGSTAQSPAESKSAFERSISHSERSGESEDPSRGVSVGDDDRMVDRAPGETSESYTLEANVQHATPPTPEQAQIQAPLPSQAAPTQATPSPPITQVAPSQVQTHTSLPSQAPPSQAPPPQGLSSQAQPSTQTQGHMAQMAAVETS